MKCYPRVVRYLVTGGATLDVRAAREALEYGSLVVSHTIDLRSIASDCEHRPCTLHRSFAFGEPCVRTERYLPAVR